MPPEVATFARTFTINNEIVEVLLAEMVTKKRTAYDTACDWLKKSYATWKSWVVPVTQTVSE